MSYGIICRQTHCRDYAAYRYTWPGKYESFVCKAHAHSVVNVADAIGMALQLIELTQADHAGYEGAKSIEAQGK